jgi:cytochrome oxidase assembly protein ShyY1
VSPDVHPAAARRPAWIPTLAAFAIVAACVTAGGWQHRRMLEKEAQQQAIAQAAKLPAVPLPKDVTDWNAWRFREVTMIGEFDARRQILVDNRVHEGRAGFDVVAPLALDDGRTVLVDRGWTPGGPTRATLPQAPPPSGRVSVRGRVDIPPAAYFELGDPAAPSGVLWQHLDPARFARATGIDVLPVVVEAIDAPTADGLARDWPMPDAGIEKHLGYMVQWYTFAAMAAGLWAWFTFRPRRGARRASAPAAGGVAQGDDARR